MHELRKDPLFSRWLAVMRESKRPQDYAPLPEPAPAGPCPFCDGRFEEIASMPAKAAPGWSAKAVRLEGGVLLPGADLGRKGVGLYDKMNSVGADEVIIESPFHDRRPEDIGDDHMGAVLRLYRDRVSSIEEDKMMRCSVICKNSDQRAGAFCSHPHSRVIATPILPFRIKTELEGAKEYFRYKERCLFCDIMDEETRGGDRIIKVTEHFVAFCPFAPKFPFEFWVMPRRHASMFKEISEAELADLAGLMAALLRRMRTVLGEPSFSYVVHSAPNMIPKKDRWHTLGDDFHWHIEFMPRLQISSGVEAGTGFYVLGTAPEEAAGYLREAHP